MMLAYVCDRCRTKSEMLSQTARWRTLSFQVDGGQCVTYHLCPACSETLSLPAGQDRKDKETIGARLLELLGELSQTQGKQKCEREHKPSSSPSA